MFVPERNRNDKLAPIRRIFEMMATKFRSSYRAGVNITVDEQLMTYRGHCPFKMFLKEKPGKYGIKIWALVDSVTYYCLNLQVYLGRTGPRAEQGQGERVALELADYISGSGTSCHR